MSANAPPPPDVNNWKAQSVGMVIFPVESQMEASQSWWKELTGIDRDSKVEKKREIRESGIFQGSGLEMTIDPFRVTWRIVPNVTEESVLEGGIPLLGSFVDSKDRFIELMSRWLAVAPPLNRISFASVLFQPVDSRESGYCTLNSYLREMNVDPLSTDLLYRVNRPVDSSSLPGIRINRLTTWAVAKFDLTLRAALIPAEVQPSAFIGHTEQYGCSLELDINTVGIPSAPAFPSDKLHAIFKELSERGTEIAKTGDLQ